MTTQTVHIQRFSTIVFPLLWIALVILFDHASPLLAADPVSDAEKSRRVAEMYADYRSDFPGIEEIDAPSAINLLGDRDVIFVDVREPEEQAVSTIPGAITDDTFLSDLEGYRGKRVIGYCTISYRSGKLAAKLGRKGITLVNLKGGLLAWVHAGGPLVRGDRQVRELHVYGRKWDLAPQAIETVY